MSKSYLPQSGVRPEEYMGSLTQVTRAGKQEGRGASQTSTSSDKIQMFAQSPDCAVAGTAAGTRRLQSKLISKVSSPCSKCPPSPPETYSSIRKPIRTDGSCPCPISCWHQLFSRHHINVGDSHGFNSLGLEVYAFSRISYQKTNMNTVILINFYFKQSIQLTFSK